VTIVATALAAIAIVVSIAALRHAKRSADASEASAAAAKSLERQSRTPDLKITLDHPAVAPQDKALYHVRNEGPQDLVSVTIYRPITRDRVTYPLALTGAGEGFADDEISFPLPLGTERTITLCCGAAPKPPEFRVRIVCVAGDDKWELTKDLPAPRGVPRPAMGPHPERARAGIVKARGFFQDVVAVGGQDTSFWLDPNRQGIAQDLRDYAARVGDSWFDNALEGIASAWDHAFATAPPPMGARVIDLNDLTPTPADLEHDRRLSENQDAARAGEERCEEALAIMNTLEGDDPA
jgi:hypothetical protein